MPKYAHYTFKDGGIALWRVDESADELYSLLHTQCYDLALSAMRNETRRAEWLAIRVLLADVLGDDKIIAYKESGAPYLTDKSYHISISHTRGYAIIAYHKYKAIGVDVEYISERVMRIAHRFTRQEEYEYINQVAENDRLMYYILNWSAKEALYKYVDDVRNVDFKSSFCLSPYKIQSSHGEILGQLCLHSMRKVRLFYNIFPDIVCTCCFD